MDVTVIVATFGDADWVRLAERRAIPSAEPQAHVVHVHGGSLHGARNQGLDTATTGWVIFLDADDELAPGYVDAMSAASGDVRVPRVEYVRRHGGTLPAFMPRVHGHDHDCDAGCLPDGNWIVIGAAARTHLVRRVGAFRAEPIYEDWSLWLRLYLAGATIRPAPDALYRAHYRPLSRNRAPSARFRDHWHWKIHADCMTGTAT